MESWTGVIRLVGIPSHLIPTPRHPSTFAAQATLAADERLHPECRWRWRRLEIKQVCISARAQAAETRISCLSFRTAAGGNERAQCFIRQQKSIGKMHEWPSAASHSKQEVKPTRPNVLIDELGADVFGRRSEMICFFMHEQQRPHIVSHHRLANSGAQPPFEDMRSAARLSEMNPTVSRVCDSSQSLMLRSSL